MVHLPRIARGIGTALIGLLATSVVVSCVAAPTQTAQGPIEPTRAEAEALVHQVLRIGGRPHAKSAKQKIVLSATLVSSKSQIASMFEYANATDIREAIEGLNGRSINLAVSYTLLSDQKARLNFVRHDTWTLIHGSGGWMIDSVRTRDKIFTLLVLPDGSRHIASHSSFDRSTGVVSFIADGLEVAWTPQGFGGWKFNVTATPAPQVAGPAAVAPPVEVAPAYVSPVYAPPDDSSDGTFHGYSCTDDCSGHQAGYDWALAHGITDPDECPVDPNNSHSFTEGCWAAAGKDGPDGDNSDSDDDNDSDN